MAQELSAFVLRQLCQFNRLHHGYPGRWRVCRFLEHQSQHLSAMPAGPVKVAKGTFLHLNPREKYDGLKTLIHGLNPREPLSNLSLQLLRAGDNAIDIGANVGYFSALASLAIGKRGQVFAFEASPSTYQRLQTLASANIFDNIRTLEAAVSDKAGELEFHCGPADHTGTASLRNLAVRTSAVVRVRTIAVDDMLDELPPIRLVKVDVEGAEALVVKGMSRLLARDQPYVLTEVTDSFLRSMGSSRVELMQAYRALGYSPFRVQRDVVPYAEQGAESEEMQCDVLMVPQGSKPPAFDDRLVGAVG